METATQGIACLTHLGVIHVQGADAAQFLQGQLTQDFVLLDAKQARLAGYCSAKGRMLASFVGFKSSPQDILLVCQRNILAATLKRLSMYVLRSKLRLFDASEAFQIYGLAGNAAVSQAPLAPQPWSRAEVEDASVVTLYPALGQARALWVAAAGSSAPAGSALGLELWQWTEVRSGIAMISAPVVEAFVPQMLNYESVGGVNFKKGCYPGQEVVARSQFRGTLKRRAHLVHGALPMDAGQEVFHESDAEQACGLVAQAAANPMGGFDAIVSLQTAAFEAGVLTLGQSSGPRLQRLELPYPLLADI